MKNILLKFLTNVLFILLNTLIVFSQQSLDKFVIHSSVIRFSDIIKYDIEHPEINKKHIGNDFEETDNQVLPQYEISKSDLVIKDPYGEIVSAAKKPSLNLLSISPTINFSAIDGVDLNPPDVNGAVGTNHIMTTLNFQVRIQNLTGGTISTVSLNSFWASVGNPNAFDPKILYEPYNNRWIFSAGANHHLGNSAFLIGVSQTNDPTGLWNLYSVDVDPTNQNWMDYPLLGYNKDWIVVSGSIALNNGGDIYSNHIYIFKKADLFAHLVSPQFTKLTGSRLIGICPAATLDNNISTLYLLQRYNGNNQGSGAIKLYSITGAIGSETISSGIIISTPNPWSSSPGIINSDGNFAPQLGSVKKINVGDDRITNTVYRNGSVWGIHNVFLPVDQVNRSAIQWWQVSTNGAIIQRGRIDDPTGAEYFAFPSIAVNSSNYALIGFAKFSPSIYASSCYALRAPSDPVNTFQSEYLFKAGQAPYYKTGGDLINRWGDYTATMTDPSGLNFWTIQQYAMTPSLTFGDRWGTWWAKVADSWDTCQVLLSISVSPSNVICSGTSVTFMAATTNSGSSPTYQWKKNGTNVGINSAIYIENALTNFDQVTCTVNSNNSCATGNPATSNTITMTVNVIDDGTVCTTDVCNSSAGTVTHTSVFIDDGFPCTTDGCNSITGIFHTPVNCGPTLYSNIFIEGYYSGEGLMQANGTGLLNYLNSVDHPDSVDVDTVFISAMSPTSPFTEVYRQPGILKTNGNVKIIFGAAVIKNNNYYLKVKHRNSIETWSASPVQLTATTSYSFSSAVTQSFPLVLGNEATTFDGLYAAIYSGDITQDGAIDASDFLELDPLIQNGEGGYTIGDLNGDASVDGTDYLIFEPNSANGVGIVTP